jgi:hypothetical protein
MASTNTNRAFGFRPVRYRSGAPYNGQFVLMAFSASDSAAAYIGDVLQFDSTNRATALTDVYAPGIPFAKAPTSGVTTTAIRGVLAGLLPEPEFNHTATASLGRRHRVASTARYALVVDDVSVIFETQEDGNDWASATDNSIGKTGDFQYAAGSTTTGMSGSMLDSSDVNTNATRPFKVLNLSQRVDNFGFTASDTLSYAKYDVMIINSDLANANNGA